MNFNVYDTFIQGLNVIEPKVFRDSRGFFMESYNKKAFQKLNIKTMFVQDNHSRSKKGVLRGIHFQTQFPQGKLVRVIRGRVYDVAVDLRKNSKTYGGWYGIELSEDNQKMMFIPEGFGHGFLALEESEFLYKTTNFYYPKYDSGIKYDDPEINIKWPELDCDYIISNKDLNLPYLKDIEGMINDTMEV